MAGKSAYGRNPHLGVSENANRDWGPYQWPAGVPSSLIGTADITWTPTSDARYVAVRKELVTLVGLLFRIAKEKYGRTFERGYTGGYNNRPIGGTSTPSGHSKGRSIDVDAQDNGMSTTWQCNLPPAMVADWESCNFYWGGRYTGKTDPMHFTYIGNKTEVARDEAKARAILGQPEIPKKPIPLPPLPLPPVVPDPDPPTPDLPTPEEDDAMVRLMKLAGDPRLLCADFGAHTYWHVTSQAQYDWLRDGLGIPELQGDQAPWTLEGFVDISGK